MTNSGKVPMTDATPQSQLAEQRCKEALECCDNDAHRMVILAALAAVRAESAARVAELEQAVADRDEALADKRRLARAIDVALHGEDGAATQASLCDLVGPAEDLRMWGHKAEQEIVLLRDALKSIDSTARRAKRGDFTGGGFATIQLIAIKALDGASHAK